MLVSSLFCHLGVLANGLLAACEDALCARQTFYQIFSFDPLPYGHQFAPPPLSDETKKFHRDRYRDFFSRPNVFETETFFRPNVFEADTETFAKVKK